MKEADYSKINPTTLNFSSFEEYQTRKREKKTKATPEELNIFDQIEKKLLTTVLSSDCKLAAALFDDGFVHVFNLDTKKEVHNYQANGTGFLTFSRDSRFIISYDFKQSSLLVYNYRTKKEHHNFALRQFDSLAISNKGEFIISVNRSKSFQVFDLKGKESFQLSLNGGSISGITWSPDDNFLILSTIEADIYIYDFIKRKIHYKFEKGHKSKIHIVFYSKLKQVGLLAQSVVTVNF